MKTEKLLYKFYVKIKKSVMNITLDNLTISLNVLSLPVSKSLEIIQFLKFKEFIFLYIINLYHKIQEIKYIYTWI